MKTRRRILALAAHTDDEFGCAGTLAKYIREGHEVHYVAFSSCPESVPAGLPSDILVKECQGCMRVLGIPPENYQIQNYPVRRFPEHRQDLLEFLYRTNKELQPDVVLLPSSHDKHQDHETVCREGQRAFKTCTILGYELPQNNVTFENSAFVRLSPELLQAKIDAVGQYESQNFRPYARPEYIRALAMVRGVQCGAEYAEAFEAIKIVVD